jgi:phytanoyl-CoA hydroxylase
MGFWLALDDIDGESGGIVALSGQHRSGLRERFRYVGDELQMMQLNQVHWNHAAARAIDAPKGTLVLLSGLVPYYISPNRSTRPRRSYLFHVYDRTARWAPDNWLRRSPNMPLVGFD